MSTSRATDYSAGPTQQRVSHTNNDVTGLSRSKQGSEQVLREQTRDRQALEAANQRPTSSIKYGASREELVGDIREEDANRKVLDTEIRDLTANIRTLSDDTSIDAKKRLAVARLMTLLDDLQASVEAKVNEDDVEDEARAQELLKAIQELSRDRERTWMLLSKKEREMKMQIALKKQRVAELQRDADRNLNTLRDTNDVQSLSVAQRIVRERTALLDEVAKLRETNDEMSRAIHETKFAVSNSTRERGNALSADEAMGNSKDPGAETIELQKRITAASTQRRQLESKTAALKNKMDKDTEKYTASMDQMKREVLMYQDECVRIEKENRELKALCDSLALTLQN